MTSLVLFSLRIVPSIDYVSILLRPVRATCTCSSAFSALARRFPRRSGYLRPTASFRLLAASLQYSEKRKTSTQLRRYLVGLRSPWAHTRRSPSPSAPAPSSTWRYDTVGEPSRTGGVEVDVISTRAGASRRPPVSPRRVSRSSISSFLVT